MHNVIVQLASLLDVLYTVEFSQHRSTYVFGVYIQVSLREFFGGPCCAQNLSNIL